MNAMIGLAEVLCRLPLVFTVGYLARSVGADIFGNWVLLLAFQVFVAGIASLGLSSSLSRFVPASGVTDAASYLRFAFSICLVPVLIVGVLAYLFGMPVTQFLGIKPELSWLLPLTTLMAAGSVADGFLDAYFKGRMAVGRQIAFITARTSIEIVAVVLVFVVTLPALDTAPQRLAGYICVVAACKAVIYPALLIGLTKGHSFPSSNRRRAFLNYGLPMVPTVLAVWLVSQSDRLVLSHFVAKADLGVYAFGASLATYVVFLGYAVYPLLLPGASRLHDDGDAAGVKALFHESQRLFVLLWAGGMAFLALWSRDIIWWTGGDAFAAAAPVLLILSFAVGLDQLLGIYQYVFHLVKRTDLILWLTLIYAAIMIGSLTFAGYARGIAWAPWAVVAATAIYNALRYRIAQRYLPIPMPDTILLKVGGIAVLTVLLSHYAADLGIGPRLVVSLVVLLPLAGLALRYLPDRSLDAVS